MSVKSRSVLLASGVVGDGDVVVPADVVDVEVVARPVILENSLAAAPVALSLMPEKMSEAVGVVLVVTGAGTVVMAM